MLHRDCFLLSSLLCVGLAFGGDPNPDTMGGKWTGQMPNGHTELTAPGNMPKGPEFTPNYEKPNPPGGGSSGWGILGFIANLGKKSAKEKRMDAVMEGIERVDSKLISGIPLTSEDYAAIGTADLTKAHTYPKPIISAPVANPLVSQPIAFVPSSVPGVQLPKGMTSCVPHDFNGFGTTNIPKFNPKLVMPMPSSGPKVPNVESLLNNNPLKGLNGPSGGGVGVGEVLQGVGGAAAVVAGLAAKTAVPATVVTTGGGAATVATTGGYGAAIIGGLSFVSFALPLVAIVCAPGIAAAYAYEYIAQPEDGIFIKAKKAQSTLPKYVPSNNAPQPNTPNPKKPEEPKGRKVNTLQRTEVMNKLKENYRYDNQTNLYKLRENGKAIKCTKTGKSVINVKWDGAHGDIEALNKGFKHMGSIDPKTLEMYKDAITTRKEF